MSKVTLSIPLYNTEKYIETTLLSALNQTHEDMEILIIDDCGTDSSINRVRQLQTEHPCGEKIRIVSHEKNLGVAAARNTAIREAKGEYLFFLDSDDYITEECITLLHTAAESEQTDIVIASHEVLWENGMKDSETQFPYLSLKGEDAFPNYIYSSQCTKMTYYIWNILFRTSFIHKNKLKFEPVKIGEDVIFFFDTMPLVNSCVLLPQKTYTYIKREGSLSQFNSRNVIPSEEIYIQLYYRQYKKKKIHELVSKPYVKDMAIQTMRDCFYATVSIVKKMHLITPSLPPKTIKEFLKCPYTLNEALTFKTKRGIAIVFWLLSILPSVLEIQLLKGYIKLKKIM